MSEYDGVVKMDHLESFISLYTRTYKKSSIINSLLEYYKPVKILNYLINQPDLAIADKIHFMLILHQYDDVIDIITPYVDVQAHPIQKLIGKSNNYKLIKHVLDIQVSADVIVNAITDVDIIRKLINHQNIEPFDKAVMAIKLNEFEMFISGLDKHKLSLADYTTLLKNIASEGYLRNLTKNQLPIKINKHDYVLFIEFLINYVDMKLYYDIGIEAALYILESDKVEDSVKLVVACMYGLYQYVKITESVTNIDINNAFSALIGNYFEINNDDVADNIINLLLSSDILTILYSPVYFSVDVLTDVPNLYNILMSASCMRNSLKIILATKVSDYEYVSNNIATTDMHSQWPELMSSITNYKMLYIILNNINVDDMITIMDIKLFKWSIAFARNVATSSRQLEINMSNFNITDEQMLIFYILLLPNSKHEINMLLDNGVNVDCFNQLPSRIIDVASFNLSFKRILLDSKVYCEQCTQTYMKYRMRTKIEQHAFTSTVVSIGMVCDLVSDTMYNSIANHIIINKKVKRIPLHVISETIFYNNVEGLSILLLHDDVELKSSTDYKLFHTNNVDILYLMLSDMRFSYENVIELVIYCIGTNDVQLIDKIFKHLRLRDVREFLHSVPNNINTSDQIIAIINNRIDTDRRFGLIAMENICISSDTLPLCLLQHMLGDKNYMSPARINYLFNCIETYLEFDTIINSNIDVNTLAYVLSCVESIRFNISGRNIHPILRSIKDELTVYNNVIRNNSFLTVLQHRMLSNELLLGVYRNTTFEDFELYRKYELADIIGRRNIIMLRDYILDGGYLPYVKHEASRLWLDLTNDERKFVETYYARMPEQDLYAKSLPFADMHAWKWYIYDTDEYSIFNYGLRHGLVKREYYGYYISLYESIINAPPTTKEYIIYRGIKYDGTPESVCETMYGPELNTTGGIIIWEAFSSCSPVKEISDNFAGDNCCLFIIIVPIGAMLLDIVHFKSEENELVLPPGAIIKHKAIKNNNIIMEYIGIKSQDEIHYFVEQDEITKQQVNDYVVHELKFA